MNATSGRLALAVTRILNYTHVDTIKRKNIDISVPTLTTQRPWTSKASKTKKTLCYHIISSFDVSRRLRFDFAYSLDEEINTELFLT